MATDYTVFIGSVQVDEITISTSRTMEDMKPFNDFVASLPNNEKHLVSLVSEYQMEAEESCFGSGDYDPTDYDCDEHDPCDDSQFYMQEEKETKQPTKQELDIIIKYNAFFGIENNEQENTHEVEDDREVCPCCGHLSELYGVPRKIGVYACFDCISSGKAK